MGDETLRKSILSDCDTQKHGPSVDSPNTSCLCGDKRSTGHCCLVVLTKRSGAFTSNVGVEQEHCCEDHVQFAEFTENNIVMSLSTACSLKNPRFDWVQHFNVTHVIQHISSPQP